MLAVGWNKLERGGVQTSAFNLWNFISRFYGAICRAVFIYLEQYFKCGCQIICIQFTFKSQVSIFCSILRQGPKAVGNLQLPTLKFLLISVFIALLPKNFLRLQTPHSKILSNFGFYCIFTKKFIFSPATITLFCRPMFFSHPNSTFFHLFHWKHTR